MDSKLLNAQTYAVDTEVDRLEKRFVVIFRTPLNDQQQEGGEDCGLFKTLCRALDERERFRQASIGNTAQCVSNMQSIGLGIAVRLTGFPPSFNIYLTNLR